ncbi:MAG: class II aldolase/adducin family protein, partial [Dehalococcoidia bacterium]
KEIDGLVKDGVDVEGRLYLHDVPVIPDDAQQTAAIASALQSRVVVLVRGHGAFARGATLWEALHWVTALEESSTIAWLRSR